MHLDRSKISFLLTERLVNLHFALKKSDIKEKRINKIKHRGYYSSIFKGPHLDYSMEGFLIKLMEIWHM